MKHTTTRLSIVLLALGLGLAAPRSAIALEPINTGFFSDAAVDGYDVVAYFQDGQPVKGSKKFTAQWHDAEWRFASAQHRDAFVDDPEAFAPQYGGYCAWAVAQGSTADIDPEAWKIIDGKLYLNYSKKIQTQWLEDVPGNIDKADANWPKLIADD